MTSYINYEESMFKQIRSLSVIDEVSNQIKKLLLDGTLKPGDLLPTEAVLSGQLGVSRTVIRESKKSLIGMGLLQVRGSRTYVVIDIFGTAIDLLGFGFLLERGNIEELIEARRVLENATATLAAIHANAETIIKLQYYLERQKESIGLEDRSIFAENDLEWHSTIAEGSNNRLLAKMVLTIRNLLGVLIAMTLKVPLSDKEALQAHTNVTDAIIRRDSQGAGQAMDAHLSHIQEIIVKLLDENNKLLINK